MKSKIKPNGAWILVAVDLKEEKRSKAGIIITGAEDAKDYKRTGTVIKVGTGTVLPNGSRTQFTVKPKDKIIFKDFIGVPVESDFQDSAMIFLLETDILAIIEDSPDARQSTKKNNAKTKA